MSINFVLDTSRNYALVQQTLLDAVRAHLPREAWSTSKQQHRTGRLNFALFVRQPADICMSHGVADKNYFTDVRDDAGALYANRLTDLFVPGPWLKRKLLAFPGLELQAHQIHTVGWPRLDVLRARAPATRRPGRTRLLWAPTHDFVKRGDEQLSTSSYPAFGACLPELERHFDVSVSLHPRNRADKQPTGELLLDADIVVSDFGTLVYEAWALGKPVVFPRWLLGERIQQYLPGSAEAHIFEHGVGLHPSSLDELVAMAHALAPVGDDVLAFMDDYLDNHRAGSPSSGARIATLLTRLAAERGCTVHPQQPLAPTGALA